MQSNEMTITNFKLGIGIPQSLPFIDSDFHESFVNMVKPEYVNIRASIGEVAELRNALVLIAQQAFCSHLIMMDADMVYPQNTIMKLIEHKDKMMVGALCFKRYPPFNPVMIKDSKIIDEWEEDELLDVDRMGTGCVLFNMRIFDEIDRPWFKKVIDDNGLVIRGEDYEFCDKVKQAGYDIYVDTSIECEHLAKIRINRKFWKMWEGLHKAGQVKY